MLVGSGTGFVTAAMSTIKPSVIPLPPVLNYKVFNPSWNPVSVKDVERL